MAIFTIIAGPNGSGKSTLTQMLNIEGRARLLDPDAIARRMNPSDPSAAAISAGREVLQRIEEYLGSRESFAVETTLASRRNVDLIHKARNSGFEVHSYSSASIALRRASCGSATACCMAAIGSRKPMSAGATRAAWPTRRTPLRFADYARVYDNSGDGHQLIIVARAGVIVWQIEPLPEWARFARAAPC